jgi:hypothetical protein
VSGDRQGVLAVARFALEISLQQAHATTRKEVNRRNDSHGAQARKLRSRVAPADEDRSG